ncbi:MAG: hypothetical protein QRY72_00220 [Candidatus Rhabdochlamydia sp.]
MTLRPRSLSSENLYLQTASTTETKACEQHLSASQESLTTSSDPSLKKVKLLSQEVFQHSEASCSKSNLSLETTVSKDRDYALMNDPFISITKIRHITPERWLFAIDHEPNNGVLVFNYGKIRPFLDEEEASEMRPDLVEFLRNSHISDSSYAYLWMSQHTLYIRAKQLDFQGHCFYKSLAQAYAPLDYTTLEEYDYLGGGYQGTLDSTPAMSMYLELIEIDPNNDNNYVLLGKTIRYHSMLMNYASRLKSDEKKILFPPGIQTEEGLYLKALEINPLNDAAYVGLGLLGVDQLENAIDVIDLKPFNEQDYVLNGAVKKRTVRKEKIQSQETFTDIDFYMKALQLNPYNLEAALLLSQQVFSIKSLEGHFVDILSVIKATVRRTPHYLVTTPHWRWCRDLKHPQTEEEGESIILKKFTHSSVEKHLKRNALKFFINSLDTSYYPEFDESITHLLALLTLTHLTNRHQDRKLIEHHFNLAIEYDSFSTCFASLLTRFLQSHFPYDEKKLKELIPSLIQAISEERGDDHFAYYHLAELTSLDETIEIRGKTFSQSELYVEAALKSYTYSYCLCAPGYTRDLSAKILTSYAITLKEDETPTQDEITRYDLTSFDTQAPLTKKNLFLKAFTIHRHSAWPYFYLGTTFTKPVEIRGKQFNSPAELFLKALKLDLSHAQAYYHLGKTLHDQESITLLNGLTLSRKQLYQRAVQLGIQEPQAYLNTAQILKEKEGILLLDQRTCLSVVDLLFRAFTLSRYAPYYLHQIALYFKKKKIF